MDPHVSLGGHHYVSFGLCFPSRRNATVLSQHLAVVCMRPVGPRKCTGVPLYYVLWLDPDVSPPDILIQQDSETVDLCMYGSTKIQSVYLLS